MNTINDDAIMGMLGRQLNVAVAKQTVASSNLANLNTPGYRTKDASFDDVLSDEVTKLGMGPYGPPKTMGTPAAQKAQAAQAARSPKMKEAEGLQSRRDGNNVQLDRELMTMTGAASDFSAAQTALAAKFRLIRYAINEGR